MNVCRVCMDDLNENDPTTENIFNTEYKNNKLFEMLESVVQDHISKEDPGPEFICKSCHEKLITSYDFLTNYSKSKIVFHLLGKSKDFRETTKEVEPEPEPKLDAVVMSRLKRKLAEQLDQNPEPVRKLPRRRERFQLVHIEKQNGGPSANTNESAEVAPPPLLYYKHQKIYSNQEFNTVMRHITDLEGQGNQNQLETAEYIQNELANAGEGGLTIHCAGCEFTANSAELVVEHIMATHTN